MREPRAPFWAMFRHGHVKTKTYIWQTIAETGLTLVSVEGSNVEGSKFWSKVPLWVTFLCTLLQQTFWDYNRQQEDGFRRCSVQTCDLMPQACIGPCASSQFARPLASIMTLSACCSCAERHYTSFTEMHSSYSAHFGSIIYFCVIEMRASVLLHINSPPLPPMQSNPLYYQSTDQTQTFEKASS